MHHKKPVPLLLQDKKRHPPCPVCGTTSYSQDGIHPQCAQEQTDGVRMQRVREAKKNEKIQNKPSNKEVLKPWHKRCPKCRAQIHIRKMTCTCGFPFGKVR